MFVLSGSKPSPSCKIIVSAQSINHLFVLLRVYLLNGIRPPALPNTMARSGLFAQRGEQWEGLNKNAGIEVSENADASLMPGGTEDLRHVGIDHSCEYGEEQPSAIAPMEEPRFPHLRRVCIGVAVCMAVIGVEHISIGLGVFGPDVDDPLAEKLALAMGQAAASSPPPSQLPRLRHHRPPSPSPPVPEPPAVKMPPPRPPPPSPIPPVPPPSPPHPVSPNPPQLPPPSPTPSVPPIPHSSVAILNARFSRSVYAADWSQNNLPDAGVLFHAMDGWEDGSKPWQPGTSDVSTSFLFEAQRESGMAIGAHTFNWASRGFILRPGVTKIQCAKPTDSSGHCGVPGTMYNEQIGPALRDWTDEQNKARRSWWNEFIVDRLPWLEDPPATLEAFVNACDLRDAFVEHFHLDASRYPCVRFTDDWDNMFDETSR
mgnify:CR=1 FL=1